MAALRRRGLRVAPFKIGPDYIDPQLHARACGCVGYNLDRYFAGPEGLLRSFARGARGDSDVAVIEGAMGLFDGVSPDSLDASAAEAAILLGAPVVLVVDASGMARSVGAIVRGFRDFEPRLRLAGVIANRLGSKGHYDYLAGPIRAEGVASLGYLMRNSEIRIPERHLGLLPAAETDLVTPLLERLADLAEATIDLARLLAVARAAPRIEIPAMAPLPRASEPVRIGWAEDEVFHFSYEENKNLLRENGAEIVPLSPLHDEKLPEALDALWLGGGFPEGFAERLSSNRAMRDAIRAFGEANGTIYAECGGLMYLCEWFERADGARVPLVGIVPGGTRMTDRLQRFGYAEATFRRDTPLGRAGTVLRGHRFHYSEYLPPVPEEDGAAYEIRRARAEGTKANREGVLVKNILATYFHIHLASRPEAAAHFVEFVRRTRLRTASSPSPRVSLR